MRRIAMLLLLFACFVASASGQSLIQAPIPAQHKHSRLDIAAHYSLLTGVAGARAVDWTATSQAMRRGFVEGELPRSVAESKPGLAAFEGGAFAVEAFASQRLFRHHPRFAILGDAVSFAVLALTDIHSYRELHAERQGALKASECPSTTNPICGH